MEPQKIITVIKNHWIASILVFVSMLLIGVGNSLNAFDRIRTFFIPDKPIQILDVGFLPYHEGRSIEVVIRYSTEVPLIVSEGDVALSYLEIPDEISWESERSETEDELWESFQKNGFKDASVSPRLVAPVGDNRMSVISGVILSKEMIEKLRNKTAVMYYMAEIKYKGGSVQLCGYGQSDSHPVYLCHKHNTYF